MMRKYNLILRAFVAMTMNIGAAAEPLPVRHIQDSMHRSMVARSENGKTLATGEFVQIVQGDQVTMRLTYKFVDGSLDDETTTYKQDGTFRLVRNHHIEKGPFFP